MAKCFLFWRRATHLINSYKKLSNALVLAIFYHIRDACTHLML